jgi:hypothetical protein
MVQRIAPVGRQFGRCGCPNAEVQPQGLIFFTLFLVKRAKKGRGLMDADGR